MYWKKWLLVFMAALWLAPGLALAGDDSTTTYVVKKGDTLWGISDRFIKDPNYWPSLWSNNPDITNPHLIYPGQKLYIYDGKIHLVPKSPEEGISDASQPGAESASDEALTEPREAITVKTYGGSEGFIGFEDLPAVGKIVDTVDNRLMMADGDTVFVELDDLRSYAPGDALAIYRQGEKVVHPATKEAFGFRISQIGSIVITAINQEVATATITRSSEEIQRSDLLLPFSAPVYEIELKQASAEQRGFLVDARGGKISLSQNDIIYLDLGFDAGVEVGNVVNITRKRMPSEVVGERTDLELPDVLLGVAVIVKTRPKTSSALVIKSADALFRGDWVTTRTE